MTASLTPADRMRRIDELVSHVWMVRTFLKHSEEAEEDDELAEVHRALYDTMHALGGPFKAGNTDEYLKFARKKLAKLRRATDDFLRLQPEISTHMNFQMAAQSLQVAVREIAELLAVFQSPGD